MSQEQIKQARSVRRRRMQERQAVIFGILIVLLAAAGLAGVGVYTEAISLPFNQDFTYKKVAVDKQVPAPCLPTDTLPVAASKIEVTVLNASKRSGLAAVVAKKLEDRKFVVAETNNAKEPRATVAIQFGVGGVAQGYTLAAHFPNAALILDEREDATVDLLIGENFTDLLAADTVPLEAETPMLTREGCTPLWELSDKVEAPAEPEGASVETPEEGATDQDEGVEEPAEDPAATEAS